MKECSLCHLCFDDYHVRCSSDDRPLAASIVGSTLIGNRYVLEKRLGKGGMGIVFKAKHQFLKNSYAIKIILPNLVEEDRNLVTRFRQEAVLAASIDHPNVIRVTDFGVEHETMPYLVMEFIDGVSLSSLFLQEKRFTPEKVYEVFLPLARGVGEAHRKGIIHRDLKPQNIMIQKGLPLRQAIKVYDFGLAKIKSTDSLGSFVQAQTMSILGSPPYMSPEQWENKDVDHRADIYALGVIIYQMLTGELPFQGDSIPTMMYQHLATPAPTFSSLGVSLSPRLEAVVRKTLEKQKTERYNSVEEMLGEFEDAMLASNIPVTAREPETEIFSSFPQGRQSFPPEPPPTVSSFPEDSLSDSQKERLKTYLDIPTSDELLADNKLAQKFLHAQDRVEQAKERFSEADKLIQELAEAQKAAEEAQRKALEAKQKVEADVRRRLELEMEQKLAVEQKAWQEAEAIRLAKEAESRKQAEERANYLAQAALEAQKLAEFERKKAEQAAQQREYEENVRRQAEMQALELARQVETEKKKYEEAKIEAEREAYLRLEAESKRQKIENDLELIAKKEAELRKIVEFEAQKQIQEQAARYEKDALAAQQRVEAARELAEQESQKREEAEAAKHLAEKQALNLAQEINEAQKRIEEMKLQVSHQPNRAEQPQSFQAPLENQDDSPLRLPKAETESALKFESSPDSNLTSANIAEKALHDSGFEMTKPNLERPTHPQKVETAPSLFDTHPSPPRKPPYLAIGAGVAFLFLAILGGISLLYFLSGKDESANSANKNTAGSANSSSAATQTPKAKEEPTQWIPGNRLKDKMQKVEGGTFKMGRDDVTPTDGTYGFQYPAHTKTVDSYYLDKTEVTNGEYWQFTQATGHPVYATTWKNGKYPDGEENNPVTWVSQKDAMAFANWISEQEKIPCRLPKEEEWEFAARNGSQETDFPWGNEWKPENANLKTGKLAAVGTTAGDETLVGGFKDMMGNVIEWTSSPLISYPKHPTGLKAEKEVYFVIRGSWAGETADLSVYAKLQTTRRREFKSDYKAAFTGFRLVCNP